MSSFVCVAKELNMGKNEKGGGDKCDTKEPERLHLVLWRLALSVGPQ